MSDLSVREKQMPFQWNINQNIVLIIMKNGITGCSGNIVLGHRLQTSDAARQIAQSYVCLPTQTFEGVKLSTKVDFLRLNFFFWKVGGIGPKKSCAAKSKKYGNFFGFEPTFCKWGSKF